jgi:hypothetical protein
MTGHHAGDAESEDEQGPMATVFSARGLAAGLLIIIGAILYVSCARDFSVIGHPFS